MRRSNKEHFQKLYEIAEAQQGYFTTKQAKAAGYADNTIPYHVRIHNWIREYRGIYRLTNFPLAENPDLILWSLWSRNRHDQPQSVYSHQTALSIHELSDLMPSKLHMTVPLNFRRNSDIPGILILHRANLNNNEIELRQGFRVTTPIRTIIDLIAEETVATNVLRQALREAIEKGLISKVSLRKLNIPITIQEKIDNLCREIDL